VASDRNAQAVQLIEPNVFDSAGFPIGQDDGFADKLGLGFIELGKDRGRYFSHRHGVARIVLKGAGASHMKACNSWQTRGKVMSMKPHAGTRLACMRITGARQLGSTPGIGEAQGIGCKLPTQRLTTRKSARIAAWLVAMLERLPPEKTRSRCIRS
jgi:hypothetical protein